MNMRKFYPLNRWLIGFVLAVIVILPACTAAKPTPTPTPIPPPSTPIPPTNTPVPPIATPEKLTATVQVPKGKPAEPIPGTSGFSESPMLKEMVAAGKIPPVEYRLPEQPFVVGPGVYLTEENLPDWKPGKYGGTLRSVSVYPDWNADVFVALNEPFLMAPKIGDQGIVCNVCQEFKVSEDNQVFTFILRKGLKWSDGQPVTTEDVRFAWEEIRNNKALYPDGPEIAFRAGYSPEGSLARFDFIDDYTFKVSFDAPYGGFLRALAIEWWVGYTILLEPAHYLKQFTNIADMRCQNSDMTNPRCAGYPALNPWIGKSSSSSNLASWERNPYYFKVDTLGQQLPYIDTITSQVVSSPEMITQKVIQGEVDFLRESAGLVNLTLFQENEAKGGFRVQMLDMHCDPTGLFIFQTYADPNWQQLAQDLRFRQAVSLAINRQEIIDTVYAGYASLPLQTVGEEYSQFDVARANALLDEIGLTQKDAEGYRQYADGKIAQILLEYIEASPDIAPVSSLTAQYLKAIGLKVTVRANNDLDFSQAQTTIFWSHDKGGFNDVGDISTISSVWSSWLTTQGKQGKEPPQWVKDIVKIEAEKWAAVPGTAGLQPKGQG